MNIEIVSMWYNEEDLAPLFLKHYSYADKIHIILDRDTNDSTESIITKYPNTSISYFKFPDMMDDSLKVNILNDKVHTIDTGWIFLLDADELLWPITHENPQEYLEDVDGDVVMGNMWQIYRHKEEADLDASLPNIYFQRRHGDPNRTTGINAMYRKPIIFRASTKPLFMPGNHSILSPKVCYSKNKSFDGGHWAMADPSYAIKRRIQGRRDRQSKHNLQTGMTLQHHKITKEQLEAELYSHLSDPQLF